MITEPYRGLPVQFILYSSTFTFLVSHTREGWQRDVTWKDENFYGFFSLYIYVYAA